MAFLQLQITTQSQYVDQLSDALTELGALAVTCADAADQPIYEPELATTPLWQQTQVIALFPIEQEPLALLNLLQQTFGEIIQEIHFTNVADQDWVSATQANFNPIQFGKNLWVCPSWHNIDDPDAVIVQLDPGLAFGTGTHPTTALCLDWLANHPPRDATVIDYGCGSGILAIAAIKLGAKKVYAIDIDPQALEATQANAAQNHIDNDQLILTTPENFKPLETDLMLANILAKPLITLAPTLAKLVKLQGIIVLSGILNDQIDEVISAYSSWFEKFEIVQQTEWARITAIKNRI